MLGYSFYKNQIHLKENNTLNALNSYSIKWFILFLMA